MLDINALKGKRIGYIPSAAGATIVEMGATAGGTDAPPQTRDTTTGNLRAEGWMQYIDSHPELAAQGFKIKTSVDVDCTQKKVAYVRADVSSCSAAPPPRMTPEEIKAKRDLLSEISVNDGGGARPSFGRRATPGAANGVPTVAFPIGFGDHGQPLDIQLLGRAWDDAKLLGQAYAFEHVAEAAGHGHVAPATAPALHRK